MSEVLGSVDTLVWLACGYALFLLFAAYGIDVASGFVSRFNTSWKSGGFTYLPPDDVWRCPQHELLRPAWFDAENRVMHYRGDPDVCNACPVKASCTDSDDGREMHRVVGPSWPASEAERFQHVLSLAPIVIALVWPVITLVSGRNAVETTLLVLTVVVVALGSVPLWRRLRRPSEPDLSAVPTTDTRSTRADGSSRGFPTLGREAHPYPGGGAVPTLKETR